MKIKTEELIGPALDWAAATAGEEWKTAHKLFPTMTLDPSFCGVGSVAVNGYVWLKPSNPFRQDPQPFSPSTLWEQGGPIIEREGLSVEPFKGKKDDWRCFDFHEGHVYEGATMLVAAMRCFVASKLGDEVDVPDELLS